MKVGTDSVLLGAWTTCHGFEQGLDIGSGTGILSLMLAQRNPRLHITGIEPNEDAFRQACENMELSPWSDRLRCQASTLQDFNPDRTFNLIISNPPFYEDDTSAPDAGRAQARQASHLSSTELLDGVNRLLTPKGQFAVIQPEDTAIRFILLAAEYGLFLRRQCQVFPDDHKPAHRRMMEFCRTRGEAVQERLMIRKAEVLSAEFKDLTRPFYLD